MVVANIKKKALFEIPVINTAYKAAVNSQHKIKFYNSLFSTLLRLRYAKHKKKFKFGLYEIFTAVSKYVFRLMRKYITLKSIGRL